MSDIISNMWKFSKTAAVLLEMDLTDTINDVIL